MAYANNKLTFNDGVNTVDVDFPLYGYRTDIMMSICSVKRRDGSYSFFDRGSEYDHRVSYFTFELIESESILFSEFWDDPDKGRVSPVSFDLGASPSGLFPFGPDLGDKGEFTFDLLSHNKRYDPIKKLFYHEISLVLVSSPGYAIPSIVSQGDVTIGTVSGLLMCQDEYNVVKNYSYVKTLNNDGSIAQIDAPTVSDAIETEYTQQCNQSLAAHLIDFLVSNRDGDVGISAPNCNFFGGD